MLKALLDRFALRQSDTAQAPPAKTDSNQALAELDLAERAYASGGKREAEAMVEKLLAANHDVPGAHLLLGRLRHERREYDDARDSYTLAECFAPAWWPVQFHFGLLALDEGRPRDAIEPLLRAIELGARDARVHNALGAAYTHCDELDLAVEQFKAALELQPDLAHAHNNLGNILYRDLEQYEAGAAHIEAALRLAPDDTAVLCTWLMVLERTGRVDEALALSEKLIARDPALAEARVARALILLSRGEYDEGWREYEHRKQLPRYRWPHHLPWPEWDGTDPQKKTVFVYPEQGLGDQIMFASCVPDLLSRGASCVLVCHPKLEQLFRRSFAPAKVTAAPQLDALPLQPDCQVGAGSLPRFLRTRQEDFPTQSGYLRADPDDVERWRKNLDALPGRLKVGISWRGGAPSTRRTSRSIPLNDWAPVLLLRNVDFVSLQYGDVIGELDRAEQSYGAKIHHWREAIDDYDQTAALVYALDLVISVQTAIVHLSGALGRRTWALISNVPEWRYGRGSDRMPWYPSVRLFRQPAAGEWQPVIEDVRLCLEREVDSKRALPQ